MAKTEKKAAPAAKGNWIISNLIKAAVVVVILIAGAIIFLNVVTKHNQEITVPDFSNLTVQEASALARQSGMRVEVTDSVFVKRMKKGAVYRQNPVAGSKVKKGRRIALTINAVNAKKISMPNLIGYSMRQAMAELQSRGLTLGKLIYVDDMATNNVLRQLYKGREIDPGTQIESESVIDLEVGLNDNDSHAYVPDVLGLRNMNAVDAIHSSSLNVSSIRFDATVKDYDDSLAAVVYKQTPEASDSVFVRKGEEVALYLTVDENKVPHRLEEKYSVK
jgi:beta-lactam-binding protein with PASTA domain